MGGPASAAGRLVARGRDPPRGVRGAGKKQPVGRREVEPVKLTPLDVRKQIFRKTMRGFDPEDVRVFLDLVADEYEQILQENGMLSEKVRHLSDQIERYHSMEKTLQNSLLTAERVSEEARERARLEADAVVADARQRGERILEDSRERLRQLSRRVQDLHREKDLFLQRFLSFLDGQMQFLRTHEGELHEIDAIDARAGEYLADTIRRTKPAEEFVGETTVGEPEETARFAEELELDPAGRREKLAASERAYGPERTPQGSLDGARQPGARQ
jgi:cell division initiation protein